MSARVKVEAPLPGSMNWSAALLFCVVRADSPAGTWPNTPKNETASPATSAAATGIAVDSRCPLSGARHQTKGRKPP